jgi:23S rRNA pseudouridine1911/1915/1917 synthase
MTHIERELKKVTIPDIEAGERIDVALTRCLGISRSIITKLIDDGDIKHRNKPVTKSEKVSTGQVIEVLLPEPPSDEAIPLTPIEGLRIVYNDDDIVVVDKPVGCAAHPSPGWVGPTVIGGLMAAGYTITTSGPVERTGIVHRLDAGTSGLMMVAKTDRAYLALKDMFRHRKVTKIYLALIQGHMDPPQGTIDAPIDRHPVHDHRFAVVADGKESITHYKVIEYYRGVSMVSVELETGRTHQIRVHFSALGHPLVGDIIYGADPVLADSMKMTRPWLHASELHFIHPVTGVQVDLQTPYAQDLKDSLALLSDAVLP